MMSLTWWQWSGIAIWLSVLVGGAAVFALALCRIAGRADAAATMDHRTVTSPPREAA